MKFDSTLRQRWSLSPSASSRPSSSTAGDGWRFDMPTGWMQGRSVFGGLSVAAAAALALRHVDPSRSLRTISAQLVRPVTPGEVQGAFRVVREGKSTTFTEVRLTQGGAETTIVSLVFAAHREGSITVPPAPRWQGPDPGSLRDFDRRPASRPDPASASTGWATADPTAGLAVHAPPEFVQHLAMRWASGGTPFSGAEEARFTGYCRFRGPAGDVEGVLGLLDGWPCPSLSVLKAPAFGSTVTWTVHILGVPDDFNGWFPYAYETVAGAGGFHTAAGHLYAPDGQLIAWSEQLIALFD